MKALYVVAIIIVLIFCYSCTQIKKNFEKLNKIAEVTADLETIPVEADSNTDAADDPAFWFNKDDSTQSIIFGSDKKKGINAYDLNGNLIKSYNIGRINNIDVISNVIINNNSFDFLGGTNRSDNSIVLFKIDNNGNLINIFANPVLTGFDDVYGFTFYLSPVSKKLFAFISDKTGVIQQWEIFMQNEVFSAKSVRIINFSSICEGMVTDQYTKSLFVAQEDKGIWKMSAEPKDTLKRLIFELKSDSNVKDDLEGMALFKTGKRKGFLFVSSQGNNSYAIFNLNGKYIGSFRIVGGDVDGTEETDGIELVTRNLGDKFPKGIFIAQDGYNKDNGSDKPQNFKIIDWRKIEDVLRNQAKNK